MGKECAEGVEVRTPIDESKKVPKATRMECARWICKMSLGEAAERIGVSPSTIDKWERYKATPSEAKMDAVAEAYGCPKEFFYGKELQSIEWNSKGWDMSFKIEK